MMKCCSCTFWMDNDRNPKSTGKCMLPLYTRLDLKPSERVARCQPCGPLDWCWMYLPARCGSTLTDEPSPWMRIRAKNVQEIGGRVGPDSEGWEQGTCLKDAEG